jgi:hypothetical protein
VESRKDLTDGAPWPRAWKILIRLLLMSAVIKQVGFQRINHHWTATSIDDLLSFP